MISNYIKITVRRVSILLFAYTLTRILFFAWNYQLLKSGSGYEILGAFVRGLRFDLSSILYTNAVLLLLWMLPQHWRSRRWFEKVDLSLFIVINFICLGTNMIDVEFTRFIGRRLTLEYIFMSQDVQNQSYGIFLTYWPFFFMLFALVGVLAGLYEKFDQDNVSWARAGIERLAIIGLTIIGMRGGFGIKPLSAVDAYFSPKHELGLLVMNSPFSLIKNLPSDDLKGSRYFNDSSEMISHLDELTHGSRPPLGVAEGYNVVVFILESFSLEDVGSYNKWSGYLPFFDKLSHSKNAFFFKNNFANSRRSIDSVHSVFCSLPALMVNSILTSEYSQNHIECLPQILKEHGYSSTFLHGAYNGSMHFDAFSPLAGFDNFVGFNEFPDKSARNLDPHWGIADEPMLQHMVSVIDEAKKPTFAGVFTLSSHHPYFIPEHLRGRFPIGTNEIHESMGYADYSLKRFFEVAQTKPWFNKTIFVFTGDHVHPTNHNEYYNALGVFRVPLMFYVPGLDQEIKVSINRITQQADIMPSVLDLLGISRKKPILFGQSVFDSGKPGLAYNYWTLGFWILDQERFVEFNRQTKTVEVHRHTNTWNLVRAPELDHDARTGERLSQLLATAQYFSDGLTNNNFYDYSKLNKVVEAEREPSNSKKPVKKD